VDKRGQIMYNTEESTERKEWEKEKQQLPDLIRIHSVHSKQGILVKGF